MPPGPSARPVPVVAGVDVGGSAIKAGLLRDVNALTDASALPTPVDRSTDAREVIEAVAAAVTNLRQVADLAAVGVVVPGIVDELAGVATWSANLGWRDIPFRARLEDRLGLPVAFGHDVRAGALAEARLGAAQGSDDSMFLAIGTGIAAGSVISGVPVSGRGWAGEVGHDDVGHTDRCACGLTGCLEAIASAGAIARRFTARTGEDVPGAATVAERARAGDAAAQQVWADAVAALGLEVSHAARLVAPEVVVVGGGLAGAGDQLLVPLRDNVATRLGGQPSPRIVAAALGDRAGCVGAGLLARDLLEADR